MIVQKNDSQSKVFTHGLTLDRKLKRFLKERGIFYRERKRNNLECMYFNRN